MGAFRYQSRLDQVAGFQRVGGDISFSRQGAGFRRCGGWAEDHQPGQARIAPEVLGAEQVAEVARVSLRDAFADTLYPLAEWRASQWWAPLYEHEGRRQRSRV